MQWPKFLMILAVIGVCVIGYLLWRPGREIYDGRHDLRSNGIWIQHGWLGDDSWFQQNNRDISEFRQINKIQELAHLLEHHGVKYVFPHLCPCNSDGEIADVDPTRVERFLDCFEGFYVIPWVGGILNTHCFPESSEWRIHFISSIMELLKNHPRLAGVQINIEPMPTGNKGFLNLLFEIRRIMPKGKILSVAAHPPKTILHLLQEVYWEESYFRAIAQYSDQMAVMMYDTAIRSTKIYQYLMSKWTTEVLKWTGITNILLGVPAYDDCGAVGYRTLGVEHLKNAILGIHASLVQFKPLPKNYSGIAIYCEWEMDEKEWDLMEDMFEK